MEEKELRICKKCLLREYDEQAYKETLEEYIIKIGNARVSDEEYSRRMDICKQCDLLNMGTCGACGCYVELRGAAQNGHCPRKKW